MERKVHCLVTAGKGVQGIHQCHLQQGFPLASALSDSSSPHFSVEIRFCSQPSDCRNPASVEARRSLQGILRPVQTQQLHFPSGEGEAASCPSCSELLGAAIAEPHIPSSAEHPLAGSTCRVYSTTLHHGVNFLSRLQRHAVTVTACGEATDGSHTFAPGSASSVAGSSLADPPSQGLNCYYELTLLCSIYAISHTKKLEDMLHWENIH